MSKQMTHYVGSKAQVSKLMGHNVALQSTLSCQLYDISWNDIASIKLHFLCHHKKKKFFLQKSPQLRNFNHKTFFNFFVVAASLLTPCVKYFSSQRAQKSFFPCLGWSVGKKKFYEETFSPQNLKPDWRPKMSNDVEATNHYYDTQTTMNKKKRQRVIYRTSFHSLAFNFVVTNRYY